MPGWVEAASSTDGVEIEEDHDSVTLRWRPPTAVRLGVGLLALWLAAIAVMVVFVTGAAIFASPVSCVMVVLPLLIALGLSAGATLGRTPGWVAWARLPGVVASVGSALLLIALLSFSPPPAVQAVEGGLAAALLAAAAWLAIEIRLRRAPRELVLTTRELRLRAEGGAPLVVPLEAVADVRREGRVVVVRHAGGEVSFGHWLGGPLLDGLADAVTDAAARRRANLGEEQRPPAELDRLRRAARAQTGEG